MHIDFKGSHYPKDLILYAVFFYVRYSAVDRDGKILDFMLSEHHDTAAARKFFKRAIGKNGVPPFNLFAALAG